ncbi:asparagine synthase (glutamine-hydrolyzing) [Sandaracinus amylolyticus]|uniref:asparagine synthase (glutamine-hydrolyzing) n=1 Tax=Sandaracinus amylolyticus TaxID=927083 RepID=A0A0F6W180_9BACT|nr:asparagine synthase (glutamine-hydrolyzing) [Sandaracinus amylolyticus]AKF04696.1 Asparagine synthetase [Sandaracinus amylolyticus]
MCGIAGAVGVVDERVREALVRMHGAQVHRGPDADGEWARVERDRGVAFAHRRLSILDVSPLGKQPMEHADGHVICFNGEIYNYRELRGELEQRGARFRSTSDTEIVLEAYAQWGEHAIERLRGMFAIAIYDARRNEVLLARDRVGIKPLYWASVERARAGRTLIFASELRAVLASGLVPRKLDPSGLSTFLWNGVVASPRTIVKDVSLLPEGTLAWVGADGTLGAQRRYWSLPPSRPREEGASVRAVSHALREAISQHLVSDVPLGVFLSGGIDSSAIAALAREVSSAPVRTFNVGFEEAEYDESTHARAVATVLGTDHVDVRLTQRDFEEGLEDALRAIDQPTFDGINTWLVSRAVRRAGITVALAGTGGDELFGGYASFRDIPLAREAASVGAVFPDRARSMLAQLVTRVATGEPGEVRPQTRWGKLEDLLATGGEMLEAYQVSYALYTRSFLAELTRHRSDDNEWGLPPERAAYLRELVGGQPDLHAISMLELSGFLGERLLRDTDAASMAVSLEVRVPLLDHVLIERLAEVPIARRFLPAQRKQLLRDLALSRLPPSLFERPKRGFELPLAAWTRQRLAGEIEHTLTDVVLCHRVGLDGEAVARAWRAYRDGAPGIYWSRIWALYVLLRWCRTHELDL